MAVTLLGNNEIDVRRHYYFLIEKSACPTWMNGLAFVLGCSNPSAFLGQCCAHVVEK